ncbi:acyl-CoA thioesterase [Salinibacter sp. 10B]|uniref:acyl-CoA thioesterase n=1 Tax=Salinibacter sp. 10B TaxID=1923971 RepID=UPI000CF3AE40|nr:acyl-CoA thioesterase [Salinibacter sp. 10B]PQJ35525.1 acyl-CoA thioesterase [Salinibacter sp. 10B]
MAPSPSSKPVSASTCMMTEIVLPNDTNSLGNMMGGRLLHLMDKCAAISAQRHANRVCVTASVDNVEFQSAIEEGEIVVVKSRVNRAFHTSMEVELNVWAENPKAETERKCNRAFYTFVAIDEDGATVDIPSIEPQSDEERERYVSAAKRRDIRLVLAGRKELQDASHFKEDMLTALQRSSDASE